MLERMLEQDTLDSSHYPHLYTWKKRLASKGVTDQAELEARLDADIKNDQKLADELSRYRQGYKSTPPSISINIGNIGTAVGGNVTTGGDFIGRDKVADEIENAVGKLCGYALRSNSNMGRNFTEEIDL